MSTFHIKRGDTLPLLRRTLTVDGDAVDLSAATVNFLLSSTRDGPGAVGAGSCSVVDATAGIVQYAWGAADTAVAGTFYAEFETIIGGKRLTAPNTGYIRIEIYQDLGDG